MDHAWTDNDQIYLIRAIPAYRAAINGKDDRAAKLIEK